MNDHPESSTPRPSILGLLLDILVRPARALSAVAEHPQRLWLVPLIIAVVVVVASVVVAVPLTRQLSAQLMEEQLANMPPEARAQAEQFMAPGSPFTTVAYLTGLLGGLLGLVVGWLFRAGVLISRPWPWAARIGSARCSASSPGRASPRSPAPWCKRSPWPSAAG